MKIRKLDPLLTLSIGLGLAACSTAEPTELGSVHVKSETIIASVGGTIEVTAADDYAPFIGTKVEVPAGALSETTKITIGVYDGSLMDDDADAAGPSVELGPSGTQFEVPVTITLPVTEAVDEDLVRVYVRNADGSREYILPTEITIDAAGESVTFTVSHFTTFQPGRARGACSHITCPSGQCRRGQCVNNNPCQVSDCGPAPGAPNYTCPDGSTAGPVCERSASGQCGWNFVTCPGTCAADSDCAVGESCVNGTCQAGSGSCGTAAGCGQGQYCCNPSCGICAPIGSGCTAQVCNSVCTTDSDCASSEQCVNGQCVAGTPCGNNVCGPGDVCCNPSCGICTPPGGSCTQQFCGCTSDSECASGEVCAASGQCIPRMQCSSDADCATASGQGRCVSGVCR